MITLKMGKQNLINEISKAFRLFDDEIDKKK